MHVAMAALWSEPTRLPFRRRGSPAAKKVVRSFDFSLNVHLCVRFMHLNYAFYYFANPTLFCNECKLVWAV